MKEVFEKIKERLEKLLGDTNFEKATQEVNESFYEGLAYAYGEALSIVSEVEAEYSNGWITDRVPSRKECGDYGRGWFLATVNANATTTIPMQYEYTTVRGKEVSRWLAYGRVSPWDVFAWQPLPSPYQPRKGE